MSYNVLIVDDHTLVRKGFRSLLLNHFPGWEIREAENGIQAILASSSCKHDLVLMDYDMPKLDGITASKQILKANPGTRILIVSMHPEHELSASLKEAGITGFIRKDAAEDDFLQAIEKVRRGIRHFPALDTPQKTACETTLTALTDREKTIFRRLVDGVSATAIAAELNISLKTVDTHKMSIFRKCGVHSVPDLIRYAYQHNAVSLQ